MVFFIYGKFCLFLFQVICYLVKQSLVEKEM